MAARLLAFLFCSALLCLLRPDEPTPCGRGFGPEAFRD